MSSRASLELSTRILMEAARGRGVEVRVLDEVDNIIRLERDGRVEYVQQATRTSADTYIAPLLMANKQVTKVLLAERGLTVPGGVAVSTLAAALARYPDVAGGGVVVKPRSTNFGLGVTVFQDPVEEGAFAAAVAAAFAHDSTVLLEEYISGREYRFLVIGGETCAVLYRVPANVVGDGVSTIAELVAAKNEDPLRGVGYVTPLEKIRLGAAEGEHLTLQGKDFTSVPVAGETVYLRKNSNISTGGDSIDCTDDVHAGYKTIAAEAARAVGASICGADVIIPNIDVAPSERSYSIIELNFNPALHIHCFPYVGENRRPEERVLDLLGFSTRGA